MQRAKIGLAHQPLDAMLAAGLARFTQVEELRLIRSGGRFNYAA
jgi:hypothetical protein